MRIFGHVIMILVLILLLFLCSTLIIGDIEPKVSRVMDADMQPTLVDICQNTPVQSVAVDHEPDDMAFNVDSVEDNANMPSCNLHPTPAVDGDASDANGVQRSTHSFEFNQEHSEIQISSAGIDDEQGCISSQSNSIQDIGVASSEVAPPPEHTESSTANINDSETPTITDFQGSPALCMEADFSITAPALEVHLTGMLHTEIVVSRSTSPAHLMGEEEARGGIDYPCDDLPSSPLPSSSPPQLFSSSPCVSSQPSESGAEPSMMVLAEEMVAFPSPHVCTHDDQVVLVTQEDPSPKPTQLPNCDATSPETDKPDVGPTPRLESDLGPSKKRMALRYDSDELCGLQPTKRPKPGADLYLPPAPKRATLASHHRQFKKLAAPFRPPTKLSVVRNEAAQTTNQTAAKTANSSTPEIAQKKTEVSMPATRLLSPQPKVSNTSRSVAQFKSPLINKVLPGDSRTIRLTPTVQTLERKLQLLKRAIKVKEDNEEEVLARLAGKWVEAGREIAYDLWDATKDAVDMEGKATLVRKAYGWHDTDQGNAPWGWDTKPEHTGEEPSDLDSSMASCNAQRSTPEDGDEEETCNHTLGTMLRQLGIDPQTFGWDDEREVFL